MLTIRESMELAGKNLLAGLLPENDRLPVWCVPIQPDLSVKINNMWFSHNVGRWWDAMLWLESATGFALPPEAEAAMLRHLRACLPGTSGGGTHAVVELELPVEKIKEWTHDTAHEFTWVGDTVRGITPNAPFLPFYPTTEAGAATP